MVVNLAEVLQRLYIWSSMLVLQKSFATYEKVLLFYWFCLGRCLNDR